MSVKKKESKEPNIDKLRSVLVEDVVKTLKPEIKKEIQAMRLDLTNDFREEIQKITIATPSIDVPNVPTPQGSPDMSGIMDMLKSGNLDMSKISQMIGSASAPMTQSNGQPMDMSKLTAGQIEYMKMENQNKMIMTFLPMVMGNQGGGIGGGVMGEVMNRLVMDKINSGIYLEKMVVNKMVKDMGGDPMPMNNLSTPTSDMINQQTMQGNKNAVK